MFSFLKVFFDKLSLICSNPYKFDTTIPDTTSEREKRMGKKEVRHRNTLLFFPNSLLVQGESMESEGEEQ